MGRGGVAPSSSYTHSVTPPGTHQSVSGAGSFTITERVENMRKLEQKAYIIYATVDEMHKMNGLSNQCNTPSGHAGLAWGIGLAIIFMLLWLQC